MASELLNAPIPGQSLTATPGGPPYEKPVQFPSPEDATEFIFDQLTKPRNSKKVGLALKAGLSCESLARTTVFAGFMEGKWTPDTALLISRPVLYMIASIGKRMGIKNLKIMEPDTSSNDFMDTIMELLPDEDEETGETIEAPLGGVELPKPYDEEAPAFQGLLGA